MKKRVISVLLCAVTIASMIVGCGNKENAKKESEKKEKVFSVALPGSPSSYNPDIGGDDFSHMIGKNLYNGLVAINCNSEIVGDLADNWEIDGLNYTFHLNKDAKWHDGKDFTAKDVKFTFETILENKGYLSGELSSIAKMECPDDDTFVVTLKESKGSFLSSLAWYGNHILPQHLYENVDDWTTCDAATKNPIGTGPFKFLEEKSGVNVVLGKNENYFKGAPKIDKVVYLISSDPDSTYQAFLNGEISHITDVPAAHVKELETNKEYSMGVLTEGRRYQMAFNMNGKYTKDLSVRKAISKAIDRNEIAKKGTNDLQKPAYGFYPPFLDWAYNEKADIGEPNVEEAIKILEDAGYVKDKDGYFFHFDLDVFNYSNYGDCAKVIKSQLEKIGIAVNISEMEEGAWAEKINSGNYDLCLLAGYQGPDPDNMTIRVGTNGGLNVSGYSNEKVDELLAKARVLTAEEERGPIYKEVQQILLEDLPFVPIVEYAGYYACPSNIVGVPYVGEDCGKLIPYNFSTVDIK